MPTDRGSARRRTIAVATVAIIAIAGGLGGFFILNGQDGKSSTIVNDGPTFHDALGAVNLSVNTVSGGPWVLSQVYGVASPVPSSPTSWGWGEYDNTLASCQAAFNGLTIWNGTIPLFDGSFNSGTAPFWQFVFFSNTTLQILVATDVLGVVHAYPPILMSSPCGMYSGLGYEPWVGSWAFYRWAFPGDTPAMASGAWNALGKSYVSWLGVLPTEMYLMGGVQFGSGQTPATQTTFFTCGTAGAAGVTRGLDVFADTYDTAEVSGSFNYTLGCTPTTNNFTAIPLEMKFSNASVNMGVGTTAVSPGVPVSGCRDTAIFGARLQHSRSYELDDRP